MGDKNVIDWLMNPGNRPPTITIDGAEHVVPIAVAALLQAVSEERDELDAEYDKLHGQMCVKEQQLAESQAEVERLKEKLRNSHRVITPSAQR